ncbi:helix-turn-helix domain-containing protein [Sphingosinicellaceae bacterium]|nr:helix-turn-helix domain-containing protein [Sphingosinicellaceae bacterium]
MDIWHLVGRNVAERRRARGWSQEVFADQCGFSQQYLSGLEKGRRNPTLKTMAELATALGIAVVDLFAELPLEVAQQPPIKRLKRKP